MKPTQSPGSSVWGHGKMSSILPERLHYNTLQQRKSNGEILYYEIFKWKMKHAPGKIHRFCDSSLSDQERQSLTSWIRNLDDRSSCQRLQILFSFSVPCLHALEHILNLSIPIISAGAVSITKKGYYQFLFCNACTLPGGGGGGGTLGISGWGCAAGTLEPLTYTRASSAEFCYPILE